MKPVQINDLYTYVFLGNLKTKGDHAVFAGSVAEEENNAYRSVLYTLKNNKVSPLTAYGSETDFVFKDENTVAFCSNREKKKDRTFLYEMALDGGEAMQTARIDRDNASLIGYLSDGTAVLSVQELMQPKETDYDVLDEIPFYFNGAGITNKKRNHIYTLKDGELKNLTPDLFSADSIKLFDDKLYVVGDEFVRKNSLRPALYVIDPITDEWQTLIEKDELSIFLFEPSADGVYVFASDNKSFGLNQNPDLYFVHDDHVEKLMDWGYCVGNTVGSDCACVGGNASLIHDNILYFTTTVKDHVELYKYENGFEPVYRSEGTIQSFVFLNDALLLIEAKPAQRQELYEVKGSETVCLSDFNKDTDISISIPQPVEYTGYDGSAMTGWVLYPKDFDKKKSYPGILDVHGGPKTVYGTVFYHEMQVWASQGYFVFFCNPHGSDGGSDEFADIRGKYGTIDYEDLMLFTDTVLKEIPQIDPKRIGVTGGSYGGFMTNWIIGHTDRFRAAASQRSISNWISFSQTSDIGPYFALDQQGASMDSDPEKLWFHSPLRYAKNVTTPTLFIHSDEDYRCPLSEGLQMLNALLDRDIEARMCVFHGENHELSRSGKPVHRVRRLNEITDWMNSHLKKTEK